MTFKSTSASDRQTCRLLLCIVGAGDLRFAARNCYIIDGFGLSSFVANCDLLPQL